MHCVHLCTVSCSLRMKARLTADVVRKKPEQCHSLQVTQMLSAAAFPELVANVTPMLNKLGGAMQASLVAAGSEPTLKDAIVCRAATAFRLVPFDAPGADPKVPLVKVQYSSHLRESCKLCQQLLYCRSCPQGSVCGSRSLSGQHGSCPV